MKLLYEVTSTKGITIIDLTRNEWTHRHSWPITLTLTVSAFLTALATELLITAIRLECAICIVVTSSRPKPLRMTEYAQCAVQIAATATQAAIEVIWKDLVYRAAETLIEKRMRKMSYA